MIRARSTASSNFSGSCLKAGGDHVHDRGHEDLAKEDEAEKGGEQHGKRILSENARLLLAVFGHGSGEERDERGAEGTLGKQAAEQVRQALGHEERIGHRPRAENCGRQNVANKAEHPAYRGIGADRGD